jgi:hypothetical protein
MILFLSVKLVAQKICKETAVYFDSGKSSLTPQAQHRLDSLVASWGNGEVHLELEGHTDSVMRADFNQKLSEDRVATVKAYLDQRVKAKLRTKVFANSENDPIANNGSEQGKAQNRRVEIKYVMLQNGDFSIPGEKGSQMTLPASALDGCSLCNTEFMISYLGTDAEIAAAGIGMQTADGDTLTTGGMLKIASNCGPFNNPPKPFPACLSFPASKMDPELSAWVTNKKGLWEPSTQYTLKG